MNDRGAPSRTGPARKLAGLALLSTSMNALAVDTTYEFDSISKFLWASNTTITGILVNDTVPTTPLCAALAMEQRMSKSRQAGKN